MVGVFSTGKPSLFNRSSMVVDLVCSASYWNNSNRSVFEKYLSKSC